MIEDDNEGYKSLVHEQFNQQAGEYEPIMSSTSRTGATHYQQAPIGYERKDEARNKRNSKSVHNLDRFDSFLPGSTTTTTTTNGNGDQEPKSNMDFYINSMNNGPYSLPILSGSYFRAPHAVDRPVELEPFENNCMSLVEPFTYQSKHYSDLFEKLN